MGRVGDQDSDSAASDLQSGHDIDIGDKESQKKHKCNYLNCNAVFLRPSRLERHIRLHTGERPYKCSHPGCTRSYTNSSHLKRHSETHNLTKKVYNCSECTLSLSNLHGLKRHYKQIHSEKKISCKECGEAFNKKNQLLKHQADVQHSASTLYKCNKCSRSYLNFIKFKEHQKTHEKSYFCSECSEEFNKWSLLCAHRKAKHVTNYKCDTCDKVFVRRQNLKLHNKIHSQDRLVLPCSYDNCYRFYFFKSNLEHHVRAKHLGKKFYCDICSMGFMAKKTLVEHIQRHYKPTKRKKNKVQRKKRKDAGVPKKSVLSALIGVNLPPNLEKMMMERETKINDSDNVLEAS